MDLESKDSFSIILSFLIANNSLAKTPENSLRISFIKRVKKIEE